ncbi:MAG TPA: NADP-dependent phosphogluconate dehydrogenase [Spirochaetota bacterium]|nr:NADP-dependent phosphogluconate dehydrogenase [Spirochaetota bacterium]HPC39654.1 NADP-dependent phosphogluconate dehydrogenase [Spirochaetota bacterium]HPL17620.1 NADP-dependent phosphogluconate dehydrogenase [Spirochaetota bacterium]HQF07381.1 NADP-dependent phosphogluconate dehydrogenase [Spirochaetota bacterium]HQH96641.1 NADP-dependent phosphogluconate dehydrogenase [Spirochaetota bacterium]
MANFDIGIVGLGIMGRNMALNFSRRGNAVAVFNPDVAGEGDLLAAFLEAHGCDGIAGARILDDVVAMLRRPRVILMMVKAGTPVDDMIHRLAPRLEPGDIIIDGGNSQYLDTARRAAAVEKQGLLYVGCGVSGGGEGALRGPSLMPGGTAGAWERVRPLLQSIAARLDDGTPCCEWIGPGGSGHFVKMVHNGIEYAMMQAIAETYDMMKRLFGMKADEIAGVFDRWNGGRLGGYLVGIVPRVLKMKDGNGLLVDSILDRAFQKGTGKEASIAALGLGVPVPAIDGAVSERCISSLIEERRRWAGVFPSGTGFTGDGKALVKDLEDALFCSIAVAHGQGFSLIQKASLEFGWGLDRGTIARVWRGGCIIQSKMMNDVEALFRKKPDAGHIIAEQPFAGAVREKQQGWRNAVASAVKHGIPAPVLSSALAYFDSYRSERLPANLLQAMRDFFGAHGYERVDAPAGTLFRTEWQR